MVYYFQVQSYNKKLIILLFYRESCEKTTKNVPILSNTLQAGKKSGNSECLSFSWLHENDHVTEVSKMVTICNHLCNQFSISLVSVWYNCNDCYCYCFCNDCYCFCNDCYCFCYGCEVDFTTICVTSRKWL